MRKWLLIQRMRSLTAFEFGLNARSNDGTLAGKLNVYNTAWNDRIATKYVQNDEGDDDIIFNRNKSESFWN